MGKYHWLRPDEPAAAKRSTRDWAVDALCFLLGFGWAVLVTWDLFRPEPVVVPEWRGSPPWLIWLDFAVATVASVGLWWRRGRLLLPLAVFCLLAAGFSVAVAVTGLIVVFSVAVHHRFAVLAPVAVLNGLIGAPFFVVRDDARNSFWESVAWGAAVVLIISLWGMVLRSRRRLIVSLRDRAERAEAEQHLRLERVRSLERTRIAREMHDVLAHRISLLSLHAGALEIRPDAAPAEVAVAAGVIRASAHQALEDLREVIGVLREDPSGGDPPERPQPTLGELPALADESRSAGVRVRLDVGIEPDGVPAGTGRTAYRIVQEGLTNARKHAPGTAVKVAVGGSAGDGLTIDIRNPWPIAGPPATIPGAGTGLIGLTERTLLAGGRLTHGRTPQNEFAVTAWLPWPAS
ncbi:histidine kinase [Micromonosporaceae bacterium Da 78-11]